MVTLLLFSIFFILWSMALTDKYCSIHQLTVLIDPGHGGIDPGSQDSRGFLEKDINLAICLKICTKLRQSGLNIVLTRTTDTDLAPFSPGKYGRHRRDLEERTKKARESGSKFFVSIHCNWSKDHHKSGSCVFYNPHFSKSKNLADIIQNELNIQHQQSTIAAPGNFFILKQSNIIAVLIEVGFLSNPSEANRLQDDGYRDFLATAISKGILIGCGQLLF